MESKELFSEKVSAGGRTYFFDVKDSADGTKYVVISESRKGKDDTFKHCRVMVFQEHIRAFRRGLAKAVKFIKAVKLLEEGNTAYHVKQAGSKRSKAYKK